MVGLIIGMGLVRGVNLDRLFTSVSRSRPGNRVKSGKSELSSTVHPGLGYSWN